MLWFVVCPPLPKDLNILDDDAQGYVTLLVLGGAIKTVNPYQSHINTLAQNMFPQCFFGPQELVKCLEGHCTNDSDELVWVRQLWWQHVSVSVGGTEVNRSHSLTLSGWESCTDVGWGVQYRGDILAHPVRGKHNFTLWLDDPPLQWLRKQPNKHNMSDSCMPLSSWCALLNQNATLTASASCFSLSLVTSQSRT